MKRKYGHKKYDEIMKEFEQDEEWLEEDCFEEELVLEETEEFESTEEFDNTNELNNTEEFEEYEDTDGEICLNKGQGNNGTEYRWHRCGADRFPVNLLPTAVLHRGESD